MPKGGARVRSGPAKDPNSERSERARAAAKKAAATSKDEPAAEVDSTVNVTKLPAGGYARRAPAFPLPQISRYGVDGKDAPATKAFRAREMAIWREVWKTPQAAAWSLDPWRWPTVGEFCRVKASVELEAGGNAALVSRLREYRNEIGLSPDGLRANGWAIARDEVTPRAAKKAAAKPAEKTTPTRRLRSVSGSTGG